MVARPGIEPQCAFFRFHNFLYFSRPTRLVRLTQTRFGALGRQVCAERVPRINQSGHSELWHGHRLCFTAIYSMEWLRTPRSLVDDDNSDLGQLGADSRARGLGQFRALKRQPAERLHQDVGDGRQALPPLVGPPAMRAYPISKEHHLFFHPVLHFPAMAVAPVVDLLRVAHDVGGDEPRIAPLFGVFRFRNHPPAATANRHHCSPGRLQSRLVFGGSLRLERQLPRLSFPSRSLGWLFCIYLIAK